MAPNLPSQVAILSRLVVCNMRAPEVRGQLGGEFPSRQAEDENENVTGVIAPKKDHIHEF